MCDGLLKRDRPQDLVPSWYHRSGAGTSLRFRLDVLFTMFWNVQIFNQNITVNTIENKKKELGTYK